MAEITNFDGRLNYIPCQYSIGVESRRVGIIQIAKGEPLSGQAKEGVKY